MNQLARADSPLHPAQVGAPQLVSSEIYRATGYGSNHPLAIARIATVLDLCEGFPPSVLRRPAIVSYTRPVVWKFECAHSPAELVSVLVHNSQGFVEFCDEQLRIALLVVVSL